MNVGTSLSPGTPWSNHSDLIMIGVPVGVPLFRQDKATRGKPEQRWQSVNLRFRRDFSPSFLRLGPMPILRPVGLENRRPRKAQQFESRRPSAVFLPAYNK